MKKELIYENDFLNADGLTVDGNGEWWIEDSKLYIDDSQTTKSGMTIWMREQMPKDVFIEYNAMVVPPKKAGNINFFFSSKTLNGDYIPDAGFTGKYEQYHKEAILHILTFTGRNEEIGIQGWSRVRQNPGFNLLSEDLNCTTEVNTPYKVEVLKKGDNIKVWINGNRVHDVTVESPLDGGCIGFRTWKTKLYFEDIKVYKVED